MTLKERVYKVLHRMKVGIVMILVQVIYAAVNVLYKLATLDGMDPKILIAYRFIFAAVSIAPVAYFVERKTRPKLTWMILGQSFLCGLLGGSLVQNLYLESLSVTSATYASSMQNLAPAITFVLAVVFRLEKLSLLKKSGMAKVSGTLVGVGGAMVLTFYKGVVINLWRTNIHINQNNGNQNHGHNHRHGTNHVLGALMSLGSSLSYASWLILQTKLSQRYPSHYSSTALLCIMGAIQALVFALLVNHDWEDWKLGWDVRLLTVAFSGVIGTGAATVVLAWCVRLKGPLYVSVFNPLMLVLVAIAGSLMLDEKLHLGSVIGAILIISGLYLVLWGKAQETKKAKKLLGSRRNDGNNVELEIDERNAQVETDINEAMASGNTNLTPDIESLGVEKGSRDNYPRES